MIKWLFIILFLLLCVPVFAERKLTTNEATILSVGPFFDSTDGITPETGITVTALTVEIYRENDAGTLPTRFANFAPTVSGGANDMALIASSVSGVYSLEITAAQVNFTGPMLLTIVDTDSAGIVGLPFWRYFDLTSANVVDAEYGTDKLQVHTDEMTAGVITSTVMATDSIGADELADAVEPLTGADTAAAVWNAATASYGDAGTYGLQAENTAGIVDTIDGNVNDIDIDVGNILTDTGAVDTTAEMRIFLTGADTPVAKDSTPLTAQEVEDTVWDAVLTGASHNTSNTAGKKLRQVEHTAVIREEEQAQGGTASTITLHTDASSVNGWYDDMQVVIVGDTGVEQVRHIHAYVGSTRVASITPDWVTTPDNTSDYVIRADSEVHVHEIDDNAISADTTSSDYLAEINAEVDTALSDINLDHLVNIAVDTNLQTTVHDDSVIGYILASVNVSAYVRTEDSLEDIRERGDAAWTTGGGTGLTPLGSGTAQSGTASTIVLAAASTFADNILNKAVIKIHTGTGAGQHRVIVTNTLVDDTCNISPNWATNPSSDSQYEIVEGSVNVTLIEGSDATDALDAAAGGATAQEVWEYNISAMANTAQAGGILIWMFNVGEGDEYIDTTQTPWQLVRNKKGTPGTEYLRKNLFDVSGGNVTSVATVIGKQTEP